MRLCRAKDVSARHLFGRAGRHTDIIAALGRAPRELKSVGVQFRRLHSTRVRSDYRYSGEVTRQDAERALDDADWVARQLTSIPDGDFRALLLVPRRMR